MRSQERLRIRKVILVGWFRLSSGVMTPLCLVERLNEVLSFSSRLVEPASETQVVSSIEEPRSVGRATSRPRPRPSRVAPCVDVGQLGDGVP